MIVISLLSSSHFCSSYDVHNIEFYQDHTMEKKEQKNQSEYGHFEFRNSFMR